MGFLQKTLENTDILYYSLVNVFHFNIFPIKQPFTWIYFGLRWVMVDIFWLLVGGGGWWLTCFGWWWVVVDIFWVVVGDAGSCWMVMGGCGW